MTCDREAIEQLLRASTSASPHLILHYLYFPAKSAATKAAATLRQEGYRTEERLGADGKNWLVLARHEVVPSEATIGAARQIMEKLTRIREEPDQGW